MNRKTWAMPANGKDQEKGESERLQTIYHNNQILLQARRTETQLSADPAPRCGFSLRGIGELIRGAGSCADEPAGVVLQVRWQREVTWQKAIRMTEI